MPHRSGKEYIVFPLDVPDARSALALVEELRDGVGVFKIGLELFVREGPSMVEAVRSAAGSAKLFLDLKLHDIPATVRGAVRAAAGLGADFLTVHCDGGTAMLKAATEAASASSGLRILGVTLLTSIGSTQLNTLGFREEFQTDPGLLVLMRSLLAENAGCHGVVCSGHEAARVRAETASDFLLVIPGIRPAWSTVHEEDQKRITTPAQAVQAGADYIVVGRPIRDAAHPVKAAEAIAREVAQAVEDLLPPLR